MFSIVRDQSNYDKFDGWEKSLPFFRSKDYLYSLGKACYVAGKSERRLQVENLNGRTIRLKPGTTEDDNGHQIQAKITILDRIKMFIFNFFQSMFEGSRTDCTRVLERVALHAYAWKEGKDLTDVQTFRLDSSVNLSRQQEQAIDNTLSKENMRYSIYKEGDAADNEMRRRVDMPAYWNYKVVR